MRFQTDEGVSPTLLGQSQARPRPCSSVQSLNSSPFLNTGINSLLTPVGSVARSMVRSVLSAALEALREWENCWRQVLTSEQLGLVDQAMDLLDDLCWIGVLGHPSQH